jgi:hypothetical protein
LDSESQSFDSQCRSLNSQSMPWASRGATVRNDCVRVQNNTSLTLLGEVAAGSLSNSSHTNSHPRRRAICTVWHMATRSETFRSAHERTHTPNKAARKRAHRPHGAHDARGRTTHENRRAGRKATYALEPRVANKRPSRKSTRKSANRAKPDTNINLRSERRQDAAHSRNARRAG